MVVLARKNEISVEDLPDFLNPESAPSRPSIPPPEGETDLAAIEKKAVILKTLDQHGGNQTRASRALNMSRRALGYRLEKYGLRGDALKSHRYGAH